LIVDKIFKIDDSDEKQKSLLKKSLEEVKKDIHSILSIDVLNHVFNEKVVNEWEKSFYLDVLNKKQNYSNIILTEKQKEKINQINKKIIIFLEKPKQ
jgi:transcriptional regulator CtsR